MTHTVILRSDYQRQLAARLIAKAPDGYVVTIAQPKRTDDQNRKPGDWIALKSSADRCNVALLTRSQIMHVDQTKSKACDFCGAVFFRDKRNTYAYWEKARFCSRLCSGRATAQMKMGRTPDVVAAFWAKAVVGLNDACWEWRGNKDKDGYGLLSFRGKMFRAARVAAQISHGQILSDQHACHSCGNKSCCNPAHIYAGSSAQNNADKLNHGTHRAGEKIAWAKLNDDAVRVIRLSSASDAELARQYGVSRAAVSLARARKTWKHVL